MLNEIKLMKPKSKDKLAGRDSIPGITDTKEEILVYREPEGGWPEPNIEIQDIYKVIHNNMNVTMSDIYKTINKNINYDGGENK